LPEEQFVLLSLVARGTVCVVVTGCQRNGLCCCHWLPEEWVMLLSLLANNCEFAHSISDFEQKQQQQKQAKS
jgi:hypothetical protein